MHMHMHAHELNHRLCGRIEAVLQHLFPAGKVVRGEYLIGNLAGQPGDSLKIHLTGAKKGYWCDFADDSHKGRSLLGLWAEVLGGDKDAFMRACKEAKAFLGIDDRYDRHFVRREAPAAPKLDRTKIRVLQEGSPVMNYLLNDRKLDALVLEAYAIGESADGAAIVFPFFAVETTEETVTISERAYMVKFLKLARPGGKKDIFTNPVGVRDSLFGKRANLPNAVKKSGTLVIAEGELDALTIAQYGYWGVSVPRGAKSADADEPKPARTVLTQKVEPSGAGKPSPNDQWIESDYDWLSNFERIYLWFDQDDKGRAAAIDVAQRIGLERCYIVKTPRGLKDANECLVAGVPQEEIAAALADAETLSPENLRWAGSFTEKVKRLLWPPGGVEPGFDLPWPFPWRIRPGEMTVWTGFSGHGKTVLLSLVMVHGAAFGERPCIASMEVEPERTLLTIWQQSNGRRLPYTDQEVSGLSFDERRALGGRRFDERFAAGVADRFLLYLPEVDETGVGRADWRKMLECFLYARQRYGCTQFVVDSLMMCVGRSEEEFAQVEQFINALAAFAKKHQCHVHLVAHSRKREDEYKPPGKQDVAGPKETADIAHNVVVVHRNLKKSNRLVQLEKELAAFKSSTQTDQAAEKDLLDELAAVRRWHDAEMHLLKQRNGDGELGSKYLFFLPNARQFVERNPNEPDTQHRNEARVYIPFKEEL
jgi:twinkle protein